jgi:tRNA threonylcarbamoyladenosine biosynthesis protein TsaB
MILALKTAGEDTEMTLVMASGTIRNLTWNSRRQLSDLLLAQLSEFLSSEGHALSELTGIIIFSGPGSFTSLRIGHSVANALADGLGIPVVGTRGDDWLAEGLGLVKTAKPGRPTLPHYGSEAHITRPKS